MKRGTCTSRRGFLTAAALLAALPWGATGCSAADGPGSTADGNDAGPASGTVAIKDTAADGADDPSADGEPGTVALLDLEPAAFDALPADAAPTGFALAGGQAPSLDEATRASIQQALDAIRTWGDVGAAIVDMASGRGICANVDAAIYGASSFKLPYALFVCEELVETGAISLDTPAETFPAGASIPIDTSSSWAAAPSHAVRTLIEAAVVQSDNDAFGVLRNNYDAHGFDAWVTRVGATDAAYRADSWYPWYSTRSSLKLWCEAWRYFARGTATAAWLSDLAARTQTSFLRDALAPAGAVVRDKAGWISTVDPALCSVSDAGIVEAAGRTYLISIMTGMPDGGTTRSLLQDLASALFAARGALA